MAVLIIIFLIYVVLESAVPSSSLGDLAITTDVPKCESKPKQSGAVKDKLGVGSPESVSNETKISQHISELDIRVKVSEFVSLSFLDT